MRKSKFNKLFTVALPLDLYELVKEFNQFYHEWPILIEENVEIRNLRLIIAETVGKTIKTGMKLLGIDVPERM